MSMEWDYFEAFSRNIGLLTRQEQEVLSKKHVSIVGMGGVGGIHLYTLARLGVQNFTIADFDIYEVGNFNRQFGAMVENLNRPKVEVMAEFVRQINPRANIKIINSALDKDNVDSFFEDADFFVDGIDAFELKTRRLLFQKSYEKEIWSVTAGPVGFGTAWVIFDPKGMSFDEYFQFSDQQSFDEMFAHFAAGLVPKSLQRSYMQEKKVNISEKTAPSIGAACNLASGVTAIEFLKCMLGKGNIFPAPYYHQFDVFKSKMVKGRLLWGNAGPVQRLKIKIIKRMLSK